MWPVETIPSVDQVFMRVHKSFYPNARLNPGVFRDHEGGMSVDWDRYSTAEEAHRRCRITADNGIVSMPVGGIRGIQGLSVQHEPLTDNRAHSEIFGDKTPERRVLLSRLIRWEVALPS